MSRPWNQEWFDDCKKWRGEVLRGNYRHWCFEWDGLPVDETTTDEFDCCLCFNCKCGARYIWKYVAEDRLHGVALIPYFYCPASRWYNFWKHEAWRDD
jgi:hypothetical protein